MPKFSIDKAAHAMAGGSGSVSLPFVTTDEDDEPILGVGFVSVPILSLVSTGFEYKTWAKRIKVFIDFAGDASVLATHIQMGILTTLAPNLQMKVMGTQPQDYRDVMRAVDETFTGPVAGGKAGPQLRKGFYSVEALEHLDWFEKKHRRTVSDDVFTRRFHDTLPDEFGHLDEVAHSGIWPTYVDKFMDHIRDRPRSLEVPHKKDVGKNNPVVYNDDYDYESEAMSGDSGSELDEWDGDGAETEDGDDDLMEFVD